MSFHKGSGAGADGMRPQHLKELVGIRSETGINFLAALCKQLNRILRGEIPSEIVMVLFGANLKPLLKEDGGIHPTASGSVYRRLVEKIVSKLVQENLGQVFRPIQLGYGAQGGCEPAVHATRTFLEASWVEARHLLKLDFKNAFNTIRDKVLHVVRNLIPDCLNYISSNYWEPNTLFCGDDTIPSNIGVQQGDPISPTLFCLVVNQLAKP